MSAKKKRLGLSVLAVLGAGLLASLFFLLGPPGLLAKSGSPLFCAGCHVMEEQYEAWFHGGAHRQVNCVDCHLPNQNPALHYVWKSIDGLKDTVVFYSGRVPERIDISPHGQEVVLANCLRCHEAAVSHIDQERLCWECHRRLSHRQSGLMQTLPEM